jgi:hypothetical protein
MFEQEVVQKEINHCGKTLLSAVAFADKYAIEPNIIYMRAKVHPHIHKVGKALYVDEQTLLWYEKMRWKIWLNSHENYYKIVEHISANKLAKLLSEYTGETAGSWGIYMSVDLWSTQWQDMGILNYKTPDKLFKFHNITNYIINKARRHNDK